MQRQRGSYRQHDYVNITKDADASLNKHMITVLLAINKASVRAIPKRISRCCLDREMRSRQHDAYPKETLETRGGDAPRLCLLRTWSSSFLNNLRYIFIVRRLSIFGITLTTLTLI